MLFLLAAYLLLDASLKASCFQVVEKEISHPEGVVEGGIVLLKCKSNEW